METKAENLKAPKSISDFLLYYMHVLVRLVQDVFGRDEDVNDVMPSPEKIVALLWIYRDDPTVVQYLCQLVENVSGNGMEFR